VSEALRKAIEAKTIYHEKVIRFNDEGRAYFETAPLNLLIEASTRAIEGLTEANEAIRRRTGELQLRNEEKAPLKSLLDANVKANTKLIAALTEVSAEMKAYTEVFQRLSKEKVSTLQSNETIRKVGNASIKVGYAITEALTTQEEAINAHHEYQRARSRARW
jgi:ERCC4-type nuclease